LPETGIYVIQVRSNVLTTTGTYNLGLECLLPTSAVDATLACGSLISRPKRTRLNSSHITFTDHANNWKTQTLTSSAFTATATVFSPTAAVVVTFSLHDALPISLPETGIYVIQVRSNVLTTTGTYNLGLECLLPTSTVDATLACGSLI